jgi:hypothetical protein
LTVTMTDKQPIDKTVLALVKKSEAIAKAAWEEGLKVKTAIGFDNSARDQKRQTYAVGKQAGTDKFEYIYPLIKWGWDRERAIEEIQKAGLPVPHKSSCTFCPAMKKHEVSRSNRGDGFTIWHTPDAGVAYLEAGYW